MTADRLGPWAATKAANDIAIYAGAEYRASAGAIARVRIPSGHEEAAWRHARVIAAAPDLLAALLRLVEDAAYHHDMESWTPSRPYQVALAALIKATGSNPLLRQAVTE